MSDQEVVARLVAAAVLLLFALRLMRNPPLRR